MFLSLIKINESVSTIVQCAVVVFSNVFLLQELLRSRKKVRVIQVGTQEASRMAKNELKATEKAVVRTSIVYSAMIFPRSVIVVLNTLNFSEFNVILYSISNFVLLTFMSMSFFMVLYKSKSFRDEFKAIFNKCINFEVVHTEQTQ